MENLILVPYSKQEFQKLIRESVTEVLSNSENLFKEDKNRVLSIDQAAEYLQLSVQTLYGYTSKRKIEFIKKGKKLYFKLIDLEQWLESGRKKTKEQIKTEARTK